MQPRGVPERVEHADEVGRRNARPRLLDHEPSGVDERQRPRLVAVHANVGPDERARDEHELPRLGRLDPVVVGQVEAELLEVGLDPEPRRQAVEEAVEAVDGDLAARLRHGLGEPGLDPGPLDGECGLPVVGDERGEAAAELGGVVEDQRHVLGACTVPAGLAQGVPPDLRVAQEPCVALAGVVVERPQEVERERLGIMLLEVPEILLEVGELALGRRRDEARHRPSVGEAELRDAPLQPGRELAHGTDPVVLERVVLRRDEHVQAQNGLLKRRVCERDPVERVLGGDREADP